jgi:predicted CoA-binding protein
MMTKEILEKFKNIAVVGMSSNPMKAAHSVPIFMLRQGYNIIPVNPTVDEIRGLKSYSNLADINENIEIVNIFQKSEKCLPIVQEAIDRKNALGDVKVIWLQEGIIYDEAKAIAELNGIIFIQDKCLLKEYNMFF